MSARLKLALVTVGLVTGCASTTAQKAAVGADVTSYSAALTVCREKAKPTKDYAVYEECAKEADQKWGKK